MSEAIATDLPLGPLAGENQEPVIRVTGLQNKFGSQIVHDNLDFEVKRGEIMGLVGGSGTGKSVLMRTIVGLNQPTSGRIEIFGLEPAKLREEERRQLRTRWGFLFQDGGLFSSLTVAQNIETPMKEHLDLPPELRHELIAMKLSMVGLPADAANKYPSELSGGMRKRAGIARALALDAEILFLDEPTAGLDPIGAAAFDQLILDLRAALGLTVVMVTHDLDSLHTICDRVSVLISKRIKVGTIAELMREPDRWITEYFAGPRGRAALETKERQDLNQKAAEAVPDRNAAREI